MAKPTTSYLGLGSNIGDRQDFIRKALKTLGDTNGIDVIRVSDMIETAALGDSSQSAYLNAVVEIKTTLSAEDLLKKLTGIETAIGRIRGEKWAPRTIDLDILLFGPQIINSPDLTVPHSQMHLRSFVLNGLVQLNPELVHPVLKEPVSKLAQRLCGGDFALNPELPQLVSIAGVIGVGKTTLTKKLTCLLGAAELFEPYDQNPFLPDVYAGKTELALDSQLFFLASRFKQLKPDTLEHGVITVTDYIFDKELIYARQLLSPEQFALYEQIYQPFASMVAKPALVIYLHDSAENCLQRIHKRNRPYEQKIEPKFLQTLGTEYEQLFAEWKSCPLIRISKSSFDCRRDEDIDHLAEQIKSYIALKE